jgi:hypothetical protein
MSQIDRGKASVITQPASTFVMPDRNGLKAFAWWRSAKCPPSRTRPMAKEIYRRIFGLPARHAALETAALNVSAKADTQPKASSEGL